MHRGSPSPDRPGRTAGGRRWATMIVGATLVATLAGCAPFVVEADTRAGVRVTAETSGEARIVRVPASRPGSGIDVQRRERRSFRIPPGHYPPPGECRIWRPGVPPGRQEPPGECGELERRLPRDAYLVVG